MNHSVLSVQKVAKNHSLKKNVIFIAKVDKYK